MQSLTDEDNKRTSPSPHRYPIEIEDQWTHAKFRDEFFKCLSKVVDTNRSDSVSDERNYLSQLKYYAQARSLIHWIPITRPADRLNPFIINLSDLSPRVRKELKEFIEFNNEKEVNFLLKEIATKFFENIDYEYTHDSVLSHLIVRPEN